MAVTGAGWIVLTAASRLYLGRHFIGDLLGPFLEPAYVNTGLASETTSRPPRCHL